VIITSKKKANTLLADHLFSPALFLAERIERGMLTVRGRSVIELGAGCALPSLLLSTLSEPPSLIVVTDYPDENIMGNLERNVERNHDVVTKGCSVRSYGYEWGTNASHLLNILCKDEKAVLGYDIVILSDLLHFSTSHDALISSVQMLLAKLESARIYVGAGSYTQTEICDTFIQKGKEGGLIFIEILDEGVEKKWLGNMSVSNLDKEALGVRKAACRYWIGCWSADRI